MPPARIRLASGEVVDAEDALIPAVRPPPPLPTAKPIATAPERIVAVKYRALANKFTAGKRFIVRARKTMVVAVVHHTNQHAPWFERTDSDALR